MAGSTLEGIAAITAGFKGIKGGIGSAKEQLEKLTPADWKKENQKEEKLKQDKGIAESEGEASKESLHAHDSLMQEMAAGLYSKSSLRKSEEAQTLANKHLTAKILALTGPDVAGQNISGADSRAIVTAIDKQTGEIITGLGTHSPQSEPDPKFTPDSPEDTLLSQVESIWGSAKKAADKAVDTDAGSPKLGTDPKFTPDSPEDTLLSQVELIWGSAKKAADGTGSDATDDPVKVDTGSSMVASGLKTQREIKNSFRLEAMKSSLAELVEIVGGQIEFDARRERREIKDAGRLLEDRRDEFRKGLGKKESSPGSPTLNKEGEGGGGFLTGLLAGGKGGKLVEWAKGFGIMLLPILAKAAVVAVLAAGAVGGGTYLYQWVKEKFGDKGDPTGDETANRDPAFDALLRKRTGGEAGLDAFTMNAAARMADIPEVEQKLSDSGLTLVNDKWNYWTGNTDNVTTVEMVPGELWETSQIKAHTIFIDATETYTAQLEKAAAEGDKEALDELGKTLESMTGVSFDPLMVSEQVKVLRALTEQMKIERDRMQKTVDKANTTDLDQLESGVLSAKVVKARAERLVDDLFTETTDKEEGRVEELQDIFLKRAGVGGSAWNVDSYFGLQSGLGLADTDIASGGGTRATIEGMLDRGEMDESDLQLLMKDEDAWGLSNFNEAQRQAMAEILVERYGYGDELGESTEAEEERKSKEKRTAEERLAESVEENAVLGLKPISVPVLDRLHNYLQQREEGSAGATTVRGAAPTGALPTGAAGSEFTNALGYDAYYYDINNIGTKRREVKLDPEDKANWDDEEIEAHLFKLRRDARKWDETTDKQIEDGQYLENDPDHRKRIEMAEALAKEIEELKQLQQDGRPTRIEVDDVLEEALTKAELKLKATDVGTPEYADAMNKVARLEQDIDELDMMSAEEFNELTPDSKIMESYYIAAQKEGSIYVHDINLERAISTLGIELGKPEAVESDWLDKLKVTVGEWAIMAPENSGQAPSMVNAPTTIDQSSKQSVNMGSSAHAPALPSGSGYMGVSTPRG